MCLSVIRSVLNNLCMSSFIIYNLPTSEKDLSQFNRYGVLNKCFCFSVSTSVADI